MAENNDVKKTKFHKILHLGQRLRKSEHKVSSKIVRIFLKISYHCDIALDANIDEDVYFCHSGFGTVINPKCSIGGGTTIQHGVTIGEMDSSHKSPVIGRNVFIGARALILGDIHIGDNARIGAGAVVIHDVPDGATVVGVPAK